MFVIPRVIIGALRRKTGRRYQCKCKRFNLFDVSKVAAEFKDFFRILVIDLWGKYVKF